MPIAVSNRNGRRQSAAPSSPPIRVPARVPTPGDSPHRLITSPRRRGEMRSLTTEKPTEATAPSPMEARICAPRNAANEPDSAVDSVPADHSRVPIISSGLRLVRSPTYAQPTAAIAVTRKLTAVTTLTTLSGWRRARPIGVYSGGTRPIATLSRDASTMKTVTLYTRRTAPTWTGAGRSSDVMPAPNHNHPDRVTPSTSGYLWHRWRAGPVQRSFNDRLPDLADDSGRHDRLRVRGRPVVGAGRRRSGVPADR